MSTTVEAIKMYCVKPSRPGDDLVNKKKAKLTSNPKTKHLPKLLTDKNSAATQGEDQVESKEFVDAILGPRPSKLEVLVPGNPYQEKEGGVVHNSELLVQERFARKNQRERQAELERALVELNCVSVDVASKERDQMAGKMLPKRDHNLVAAQAARKWLGFQTHESKVSTVDATRQLIQEERKKMENLFRVRREREQLLGASPVSAALNTSMASGGHFDSGMSVVSGGPSTKKKKQPKHGASTPQGARKTPQPVARKVLQTPAPGEKSTYVGGGFELEPEGESQQQRSASAPLLQTRPDDVWDNTTTVEKERHHAVLLQPGEAPKAEVADVYEVLDTIHKKGVHSAKPTNAVTQTVCAAYLYGKQPSRSRLQIENSHLLNQAIAPAITPSTAWYYNPDAGDHYLQEMQEIRDRLKAQDLENKRLLLAVKADDSTVVGDRPLRRSKVKSSFKGESNASTPAGSTRRDRKESTTSSSSNKKEKPKTSAQQGEGSPTAASAKTKQKDGPAKEEENKTADPPPIQNGEEQKKKDEAPTTATEDPVATTTTPSDEEKKEKEEEVAPTQRKEENEEAVADSPPPHDGAEDSKAQTLAATKIQAVQRGKKGRSKAASKKAEKEKRAEEEAAEREAAQAKAQEQKEREEEQEKAPSSSSPVNRTPKDAKTEEDPPTAAAAAAPQAEVDEQEAATRIQAAQRGKLGRAEASAKKQELKAKTDAVVKIQSVERGRQDRTRVATKRAEQRVKEEAASSPSSPPQQPQQGGDALVDEDESQGYSQDDQTPSPSRARTADGKPGTEAEDESQGYTSEEQSPAQSPSKKQKEDQKVEEEATTLGVSATPRAQPVGDDDVKSKSQTPPETGSPTEDPAYSSDEGDEEEEENYEDDAEEGEGDDADQLATMLAALKKRPGSSKGAEQPAAVPDHVLLMQQQAGQGNGSRPNTSERNSGRQGPSGTVFDRPAGVGERPGGARPDGAGGRPDGAGGAGGGRRGRASRGGQETVSERPTTSESVRPSSRASADQNRTENAFFSNPANRTPRSIQSMTPTDEQLLSHRSGSEASARPRDKKEKSKKEKKEKKSKERRGSGTALDAFGGSQRSRGSIPTVSEETLDSGATDDVVGDGGFANIDIGGSRGSRSKKRRNSQQQQQGLGDDDVDAFGNPPDASGGGGYDEDVFGDLDGGKKKKKKKDKKSKKVKDDFE